MGIAAPVFEIQTIANGLRDGYWIHAADLTGDGSPDIITSGLAEGRISWYENSSSWTKRDIAQLHRPVALDTWDVSGDGSQDIIICHDYGESLYACQPERGLVSWLRNPGKFDGSVTWDRHDIAQLCSSHRVLPVRLGHAGESYVLVAPMVGPRGGREAVDEPVQLTAYRQPQTPDAEHWPAEVIDDVSYSVVHELSPGSRIRPREEQPLLVASAEGITALQYDTDTRRWCAKRIGEGETSQHSRTGFRGSNSASAGVLQSSGGRYVAALEPFHGNTVAVYSHADECSTGEWERTVLDVYGDPNEMGEGPGHDLVCGDFDNDGDDEFLVALRGPEPWQGVFYYKAIDPAKGLWTKKRVSTESAARIAVADFDGDGLLDFATIGYYTPGYFLADDPKVIVAYNRTVRE